MVIAVDFDGTLQKGTTANIPLIQRLRKAKKSGDTIILWTCREGKKLNDAILFLQSFQFKPDFINCNPPWVVRQLGYDPRKVLADVYIDDKAVN